MTEEKRKVLGKLNEALLECKEVGLRIGVSRMWGGTRTKYAVMIGEDVEFNQSTMSFYYNSPRSGDND